MRFEPVPGLSIYGTRTSSLTPAARARRRRPNPSRASDASVQVLESRMMLSASLVKEINTTLRDSNPQNFVVFNGALYFTADDGVHGMEL